MQGKVSPALQRFNAFHHVENDRPRRCCDLISKRGLYSGKRLLSAPRGGPPLPGCGFEHLNRELGFIQCGRG